MYTVREKCFGTVPIPQDVDKKMIFFLPYFRNLPPPRCRERVESLKNPIVISMGCNFVEISVVINFETLDLGA